MLQKLIPYRLVFIIITLLYCSLFTESHFFNNYYDEPVFYIYFLVTILNFTVYLIPTDKSIFAEKLTYSWLLSIMTLFSGFMITSIIMGLFYGYDDMYDELSSPQLLTETVFYFTSNLIGIWLLSVWVKYRKPMYE